MSTSSFIGQFGNRSALDSCDAEQISAFVNHILVSEAFTISVEQRRHATRELLSLLSNNKKDVAFNTEAELLKAVTALKILGRTAAGTEDLAEHEGLLVMLELSQVTSPNFGSLLQGDLPAVSVEATRCLANVCLLHESARVRLGTIPNLIESLLLACKPLVSLPIQFLSARLLFLITSFSSNVICQLVEEFNVAKYLSEQLSRLMDTIIYAEALAVTRLAEGVLIEYLKISFNISLFYPRICQGRNTPSPSENVLQRQIGITSPLSRPAQSPYDRLQGAENIESEHGPERTRVTLSDAPKLTSQNGDETAEFLKCWGFQDVISSIVHVALCLPFDNGFDRASAGAYKNTITALLNYNIATYSSIFFAPLSPEGAQSIPPLPFTSMTLREPYLPPLPARLLTLLDETMHLFFPSGLDENKTGVAEAATPASLDESLSFLLILLAKCVAEDVTGDVRKAIKTCLLADDIDRTVGLEKRRDTTGRLVQLMSSSFFTACSDAAGRFLFELCDQNRKFPYLSSGAATVLTQLARYTATIFAATLGYGNASGFLQSINMLIPPPPFEVPASGSRALPIDPITGAYEQPKDEEPDMTDEEKELEAEKLLVLFDRLNKNGIISAEDPVKAAQRSGKLSLSNHEEAMERKMIQDEEDEEERLSLEELQRYKERKTC